MAQQRYFHEHGVNRIQLQSVYTRNQSKDRYQGFHVIGWFCLVCGFQPNELTKLRILRAHGLDVKGVEAFEYGGYGKNSGIIETPGVSIEDAKKQRRYTFGRLARLGKTNPHAPGVSRDVLPGA